MIKNHKFYISFLIVTAGLTAINIINASTPDAFDPLVDVTDLVEKRYVKQVEEGKIITDAINGMLSELDPYSEYIPPAREKEFNMQTSGNFTGIGISIDQKDDAIVIITPLEQSPARKAGIKSGDVIVEIDDKSTQDWNVARAVKEMEGPEGAELKLQIYRGSTGELKTFNIKREKIQMHSVRGWRLDENGEWDYHLDKANGIGYLRISQFIDSTLDDFNKIMAELLDTEMKALILDLRSNPGGLMYSATGIIDRLIPQGVILKTRGENSPEQVHNAKADNTLPEFHMVVLIDQISASASEIVAGALRDHKRATVIGVRSWGKGSVQRTFKLPGNRGIVKLTTDYYYLPNGNCVHRLEGAETWGVEPDIKVEFNADNYQKMAELMNFLHGRENGEKSEEKKHQHENETTAELCSQLLQLDNQLNAAVDQCRELIKTEPGLQPIASNDLSAD